MTVRTPHPKIGIRSLAPRDLETWLTEQGEAPYRVAQLQTWLYRQWACRFDEMLNLPRSLRARLAEDFLPFTLIPRDALSGTDGTVKWLFELPDGETIETVLIRAHRRSTVCISTQVGCPVRCVFCASGRGGWIRDLSAGEIIDQVIHACRHLGERVTNVVVMGMGEPLLNLDAVIPAMEALCDADRLGLSARHITISTSGIVPGILRLAELQHPWNLALSLHAGSDSRRSRLIPGKHRFPLRDVLAACRTYRERSGRMVTLEYALFAGENDSDADMDELAAIALDLHAKVNLIPCNPVSGQHAPPQDKAVRRALETLLSRRVQATIRQRKGDDIQAACGQLRRQSLPTS